MGEITREEVVKSLRDCSPGELSALINVVRLAADLYGQNMLPEHCKDLEDAVLEVTGLMDLALRPISDDGDDECDVSPENN